MTARVAAPAPAGSPSATMTVPELAERVGVDTSTAYRYLRAGQLPGVQVGEKWSIDRARVERFMAGQEDASGRVLIHAPPANELPALTLLPERTLDSAALAVSWLRGARAALELLVDTAEQRVVAANEERRVLGA